MKHSLCLFLTSGALLVATVNVHAQNRCTHLGNDVICPSGVASGSNSVTFTPTGIQWSDGSTTTGFNVPLFPVTAPPTSPLPPSSPAAPGTSTSEPTSPTLIDSEPDVFESGGEDPPDTFLGVIEIQDHLQQVQDDPETKPEPVVWLTKEEFDELERLLSPEPKVGTREHYDRKNDGLKERRIQIATHFQGSGDLAGAAEALLSIGGGMEYDQADTGKLSPGEAALYVGASPESLLPAASKANCYEFVHFVAWLSGHGAGPLHQAAGGVRGVLEPQKMKVWDSTSEIPRGMVIVGCVGYDKDSSKRFFGGTPQDDFGFIHVGISLGNGMVVSNRGAGAKIEKIKDVFGDYTGTLSGGKVYFGQYDGYGLPDSPSDFLEDQTNALTEGASDPGDVPPEDPEERANWEEMKAFSLESKGRLAVIQAFNDGTSLSNPTPDQQAYEAFLLEGLKLSSEGAPFHFKDVNRWVESNQAAKDRAGPLATAIPLVAPQDAAPQVLTPEHEDQAGLLRTPDVTAITGRALIR